MEQNKIRSYLFYAIGEIALVMIGILLALQVNNWNEGNKLRKKENISLQKLAINLEDDIRLLKEIIQEDSLILAELHEMSQQILEADSIEDVSFTDASFKGAQFYPNKTTINTLESSGQLDIVQNQVIIDRLILYYRSVTIAKEGIDVALKNFNRDIENFFTRFDHLREHPRLQKRSIEDYLQDPFLLNAFYLKKGLIQRQINNYQQLQKDATDILTIIKNEVEE
jgi:hypothetical protein